MLSRLSSSAWMEGGGGEEDPSDAAVSFPTLANSGGAGGGILDDNWYISSASAAYDQSFGGGHHLPSDAFLLPPQVGPTSQQHPFLSSLLTATSSPIPFDPNGFDPNYAGILGFGGSGADLSPITQFPNSGSTSGAGLNFNPLSFEGFDNSSAPFLNRAKILRPLETSPPVGSPPTLFQKRAARQNGVLGFLEGEKEEKRRKGNEEDELDDGSIDGSGLNYDSEEPGPENGKGEEEGKDEGGGNNGSNGNSMVTGEQKGKKKGLPAKNLMAERRRRKKLNDRLYMLRSVVPKISKMDRASILGDAIEYLQELLQRINDLHNELEATPSSSSLPTPTAASFHPLTPTLTTLPSCVKEELCPSSLPSPNGQQARVEVRVREGRAVNIHMFCARRPGLLLSTMRALDGLGLDIQQAVISCFNGFALDVFRAEQCKDGPRVLPEEIKAVLLHSAGFQSAM